MAPAPLCACGCGASVPRRGKSGPLPIYASPACRTRAHRRRKITDALVPIPSVIRDAPVALPTRSQEEQVQRAVLETRAIGFALQRLGATSRPDLAWRCRHLGEAIIAALEESFGGMAL